MQATVVDDMTTGTSNTQSHAPQHTASATQFPSTFPTEIHQNNVPTEAFQPITNPVHPHSLNENQHYPTQSLNERVYSGSTSGANVPSPPASLHPLRVPPNLTSYIWPQSVYRSPGLHPSGYSHVHPHTEYRDHVVINQAVYSADHPPTNAPTYSPDRLPTNPPVHSQDRLVQSVHTEQRVHPPARSQVLPPGMPAHHAAGDYYPISDPLPSRFSTPVHTNIDQTPNQQEPRHPPRVNVPLPGPPLYHSDPTPPNPQFIHSVHPTVSTQRVPSPVQPILPPEIPEKVPLADTTEDLSDDNASVVSSCAEDGHSDIEHKNPSTVIHLGS